MAEWAKPIEEEVDMPTRFSFECSGSSLFAEESHCLQYFGSAFWKYPVHIFVGSIIKEACYNNDQLCNIVHERRSRFLFHCYCDMVCDLVEEFCKFFDVKYKTMHDLMARGALQSLSLLRKADTLSDFRMLLQEDVRIFVLGLYKFKYFKYFILSYAICLKLHCVGVVEEKIKIASKTSVQTKKEQLMFIKQKRRGIQKERVNIFKYYLSKEKQQLIFAIESSVAALAILSSISETKMDTIALPKIPKHTDDLDGYMLQVYEIKLTSILAELKNLFDLDHSRHLDVRQISKDIVKSYTSLVTDVWHTELSAFDGLDTLKPKDTVTKIRETINSLVDYCVVLL